MANLTTNALNALENVNIEPKIILQVDGVSTLYSATAIRELVRIGDDLEIGDFIIGGYKNADNQSEIISFTNSQTRFKDSLEPDKGRSTSVTSLKIRLIDKDLEATKLITPGEVVPDVMYRKAKVWIGFGNDTGFPEDYIVIFRGVIDDIMSGPGFVDLNISNTDQKKRQSLFSKLDAEIPAAITDVQTVVEITNIDTLVEIVNDPATGIPDPTLKKYLVIEDELMEYTAIGTEGAGANGGTNLTVTRGQLLTTAVSHSIDTPVASYYVLEENSLTLALKMMLSDEAQSSYVTLTSQSVNQINPSLNVPNTFVFKGQLIQFLNNVQVGDFVTTSGFTNPANNLASLTKIVDIVETADASYILVDATLADELDTSGTVVFTSQYNTLGTGLGMVPDEVDIDQHNLIRTRFLIGANVRHYIKDTLEDIKDFIDLQLYFPFAAYGLSRSARSSVNYTIGPIPGDSTPLLNITNIKDPKTIVLRRSLNKNFYNTVIYKYDPEVDPESERYLRGTVVLDATSKFRIPIGNKPLTIPADGIREELNGKQLSTSAGQRFINRYKFGAEYLRNVKLQFSVAVGVDVGDIALVDFTGLKVSNTIDANRTKPSAFFEIISRSVDIKTGEITFDLVDTNYSTQTRYGLFSPSSLIDTVVSDKKFNIKQSFGSQFGTEEYRKWEPYVTLKDFPYVRIHNSDWTLVDEKQIVDLSNNQVTLDSDLSFTPTVDMIMELSNYKSDQTDNVKLMYAHANQAGFADGTDPYQYV